MSGDALARGAKRASFSMPSGLPDGEIRKNYTEIDVPSTVDNSALFAVEKPRVSYQGKPLGDRVLVKRVVRQSGSALIIPESAQAKSDTGKVISVGDGLIDLTTGHRTPVNLSVGELVLFDRFAAVGQEVNLLDEDGHEAEHLILQASDILLVLKEVHRVVQ